MVHCRIDFQANARERHHPIPCAHTSDHPGRVDWAVAIMQKCFHRIKVKFYAGAYHATIRVTDQRASTSAQHAPLASRSI